MGRELLIALALVMVMEGLVPFLNPSGLRRTLALLTQMDDRVIRGVGFASMLAGVIVLYVVR